MQESISTQLDELNVAVEALREAQSVGITWQRPRLQQVEELMPALPNNNVLPLPPAMPPMIPHAANWEEVVHQWNEGDVTKNLGLPLSQWTNGIRNSSATTR